MGKLREDYDKYLEGLEIENLIDEAIDFEDYRYMYSLYLRKLGFFEDSEDGLDLALMELDKLSKIDFIDVRELGMEVAIREGFHGKLKEEISNSTVDFERFNVVSRENSREYIETDIGIVNFDLPKFLRENTSLRVKDGYNIVIYRIKNNFEDKYKLVAFRNFGMDYILKDDVVLDTYFEGVDLCFPKGYENYLEFLKGDGSLFSFVDTLSFFNEINNLNEEEEEILYGENRYLSNAYIPNEPTLYEVEDKIYIDYTSIQKGDSGNYDTFIKNIVLFQNREFSLKKFRKEVGSI